MSQSNLTTEIRNFSTGITNSNIIPFIPKIIKDKTNAFALSRAKLISEKENLHKILMNPLKFLMKKAEKTFKIYPTFDNHKKEALEKAQLTYIDSLRKGNTEKYNLIKEKLKEFSDESFINAISQILNRDHSPFNQEEKEQIIIHQVKILNQKIFEHLTKFDDNRAAHEQKDSAREAKKAEAQKEKTTEEVVHLLSKKIGKLSITIEKLKTQKQPIHKPPANKKKSKSNTKRKNYTKSPKKEQGEVVNVPRVPKKDTGSANKRRKLQ
jgi:hypothetical protein